MPRKQLPPLVMSAKTSVWRMHDHADEADKVFQKIRRVVLEAYDYQCPYCEHQAEKYQEAHHCDDDHKNNAPDNLACTCPLCHQVFHIGLAGMREGAVLAYIPELTQAELNHLCLIIWLLTEVDGNRYPDPQDAVRVSRLAARAKDIEGQLSLRHGAVLLKLRMALKGTSFPEELAQKIKLSYLSPTLLANVLMGLDEETYAKRGELLGGLRLLPRPARFRRQIDYWADEQDKSMPPYAWHKLIPEEDIVAIIEGTMDNIAKLKAAA